MTADSETLLIQASDLIEHLYCPRFTYYELCLNVPEHQHLRPKVQTGRTVHRIKQIRNRAYLRKKIGCISREFGVYLSSPEHHMRGIVDEVLTLEDGSKAVLDYKFATCPRKIYRTHKLQLVFYSRLVSLHYQCEVKRGFLLYVRSNNKMVEVSIRANDYERLGGFIAKIVETIACGYFPPPTPYRGRCADCCYKNICPQGYL
jgi:CRISPR-associated exonuclease Cas4